MENRVRGPVIGRRAGLAAGAALLVAGRQVKAAPPLTIRSADGRDVQITHWPAKGGMRAMVLFSHGALSSPWKYQLLVQPWADAGFEVYAPLHVDSTEHPDHAKYGMLESWAARLQDMRALAKYVGAQPYIAAGHSYGALIALTLGGASAAIPPGVTPPLRDPNAKALIAFSPPGPSPGLITAAGYAALAVPALIETGTADIPFNAKDGNWRVHLAAFDAAPGAQTYALVLPDVNHYFGGLICRPELPGPKQAAQFRVALDASTLFLRAFGAGEKAALSQLRLVPGLQEKKQD